MVMNLKKKINNKVAIVTGAGSGIGKAVALGLAREGVETYLAGRKKDKLLNTKQISIKENNKGNCHVIKCDVSKETDVRKMFMLIQKHHGRLDLLFNNAGMNAPGIPLEELEFTQWQSVVDVNLTGSFNCLQAAFRVMKDQNPMGGRIINNGSISAHAPRPDSIPYTATKHAVSGMTKTAALDGRKYNIAVGQIDVGNAVTVLASRMAKGVKQADGEIRAEDMMDAEEVGRGVAHMASLPLSTNILTMTIMATKMPFVGRG